MSKDYIFSKERHMDESDVKMLTVDKVTQQTDEEVLLRFNVPALYDPGQFFQVSLFGIGEAPISICSCSEDYFEMSVRGVGNLSKQLCQLKEGDSVGLRGPYGNGYHLQNFVGDSAIVIAGGCGVAPVRGVVQYLKEHRNDYKDIALFFGFRAEKDILFEEDYQAWKEKNMDVDVVLSDKSSRPDMKHGLITDILDTPILQTNEKKIVFICGPPPMIKAVCKVLLDKGFHKDQIYISEERQMKCAVGRCGHCMINGKYCCTDGPVFRYDELCEESEGYKEEGK